MIDHYDAFISYRHSDKDIRVASRIQSDLEHFYIPSGIRKATGRKRIDRIFLDKDELGAASNLSSDISKALDHTEHLIVICSTTTKESTWVQREIEYFLQSHTRQQITTVLVDGEPEDVIPDILRFEEKTVTDPDGSTHTVRIPQEPLSCDYRLPRRKAKKEELPRLASKLLECSYDELMNRRRAFVIRRLAIIISLIAAAIIAFDVYLIYSSIMIRKNLESSLRNQSIYLANESLDALGNDQRILSLQLALESLPKDADDSRPVTPQAIRALTASTLSYTTRDGFGIQDIWSYSMPETIENNNCRLSPFGKELAAWDKSGNVRVWDTETHDLLFILNKSGNTGNVFFLPDDRLLVLSSDKITAYRISDGSCLWEKKTTANSFASDYVTLPDNSLLFATTDLKLLQLDPEDGSEMAVYALPNVSGEAIMSISSLQISPGNRKIALKIFKDVASSLILIYDLESGTTHKIDPDEYITAFLFGDDEHLIMACPEDVMASSSSAKNSIHTKTDHVKILCYDPDTLTQLWNRDLTSTNVTIRSEFLLLPEKKAVAYYHANKAEIYSIADGTLMASHNTNDSIIMGQDPDGSGQPLYVTEKGGLALPGSGDSITIDHYFADDLDQVLFHPETGFFAHPSGSSEIIHYGLYVCDEDLKLLKSGSEIGFPEASYMDDRVLAVLTYESPDDYPGVVTDTETEELLVLTLADPATGEQISAIPLTEEGSSLRTYSIRFLGSEDSHFYIGHSANKSGYRILDIDPGTGKYTSFVLAEEEPDIYRDFCTFSNGRFYYCSRNQDSIALFAYDPHTKEITEYAIGDGADDSVLEKAPLVLPERNSVLLSCGNETILIDLGSKSTKRLAVPTGQPTIFYAYNAGGDTFALSDKKEFRLIPLGGGEELVINCPASPLGICFFTDQKDGNKTYLLVPSTDGYLYRYNAETGAILSQSDLTLPDTANADTVFRYYKGKGLLYLQLGNTLSIIETETWYEETSIQRCLGYHAPGDRFYVYTHPAEMIYQVGFFEHYPVEDLIKKAKDMLKDNKMPDEVKAEYGIEITEE